MSDSENLCSGTYVSLNVLIVSVDSWLVSILTIDIEEEENSDGDEPYTYGNNNTVEQNLFYMIGFIILWIVSMFIIYLDFDISPIRWWWSLHTRSWRSV